MALFPTSDLKLRFDGRGFTCDLEIVDGDLALDATPATPMLVSLGTDRRALPDDRLPDGAGPLTSPSSWTARRGWVGDCLSRAGRRIGSRLWQLCREHDDEATRRRADAYAREALAWARRDFDITPEIDVSWARAGLLQIRAYIDGRSVVLRRALT